MKDGKSDYIFSKVMLMAYIPNAGLQIEKRNVLNDLDLTGINLNVRRIIPAITYEQLDGNALIDPPVDSMPVEANTSWTDEFMRRDLMWMDDPEIRDPDEVLG